MLSEIELSNDIKKKYIKCCSISIKLPFRKKVNRLDAKGWLSTMQQKYDNWEPNIPKVIYDRDGAGKSVDGKATGKDHFGFPEYLTIDCMLPIMDSEGNIAKIDKKQIWAPILNKRYAHWYDLMEFLGKWRSKWLGRSADGTKRMGWYSQNEAKENCMYLYPVKLYSESQNRVYNATKVNNIQELFHKPNKDETIQERHHQIGRRILAIHKVIKPKHDLIR